MVINHETIIQSFSIHRWIIESYFAVYPGERPSFRSLYPIIRVSRTCSMACERNFAVVNFLVYDFIVATQTDSNDISLDAKSCLSVAGLFLCNRPFVFHGRIIPRPFPSMASCRWNATTRGGVRLYVQRLSRYFQYPATDPTFPLLHPRHVHPPPPPRKPFCFPSFATRPRVVRVDDAHRDTVSIQRSKKTDLSVYRVLGCIRLIKYPGRTISSFFKHSRFLTEVSSLW